MIISAPPICMTCTPEAPLTRASGWCRFHGLQALAQFDLATPAERVELFLREYWPHWVTISAATAYLGWHLLAWAFVGFRVVSV